MRRRTTVAFAIFAALLMVTGAATAQSGLSVASIHTTFGTGDGEDSPSSLSATQLGETAIIGSGQDADVRLLGSELVERSDDDFESGGNYTERAGLVIEPKTQISELSFETSSETVGVTMAYIEDSNGNVLHSTQHGGGTARFEDISLTEGNTYRLTMDRDGDEYTPGYDDAETSFPVEGQYLNITTGVGDSGTENRAQVVNDIRAYAEAPAENEGTYIGATHSESDIDQAWTDLSLENSSAHVRWEYESGGSWSVANESTFTATGNHTLNVSSVSADNWRVNVTFDASSGESVSRLHDEGLLFDSNDPTVSDAKPSGTLESSEVTLQANVSDADFPTRSDEEVTATFYWDGNSVGQDTITSNGTVSTTYDASIGGNHTWHVDVTDNYGNTNSSDTVDVTVPDTLNVYYETEPEKLVNDTNTTLTFRFFPLDDGDVVTREVQDGSVDLGGLPVDRRFVVTVEANGTEEFVYRRVVIEDIYSTDRLFLLRENESTSQVVFELSDPAGQFPPEDTVLYIDKPIAINGTTDYYTVAGDTFGATGRFPAILQSDARYRLRVQGNDSERALGYYTVYGNTVETLQIQQIEPRSGDQDTSLVYGSLTQEQGTSTLAVRFRDGTPDTTVTYEVRNASGDVVVPETTVTGESFAHMYEFQNTGTQSYNVTYSVTTDGTTRTGSFTAGHVGEIADRFQIDGQVLSIMSYVAILAAMGLIVIVDSSLAPLAGTGMASVLTIMGTVTIPASFLGIAGAISVLTIVGRRR